MCPRASDKADVEAQEPEDNSEDNGDNPDDPQDDQQGKLNDEHQQSNNNNNNHNKHQQFSRQSAGIQKFKNNKSKSTYKRINVDPSRRYHTPEARESWGPNVKGKKFRKEKGKKKRSTGTGARIDGSVRSVRLDA